MEKLAELKKIKEALEVLINESEKPKFEVNKWYKTVYGSFYYISKIEGNLCFGYGIDNSYIGSDSKWHDYGDQCLINRIEREATPSEVQEALEKEAVKRGFKEGVKFIHDGLINEYGDKTSACERIMIGVFFEYNNNVLRMGNSVIYSNGIWATILPSKKQMTISQIEKELGYEIEIINKQL